MFLISDAIIGMWYVFGNWIIGILWPDVISSKAKLESDIESIKQERDKHVRGYEDTIESLKTSVNELQGFYEAEMAKKVKPTKAPKRVKKAK